MDSNASLKRYSGTGLFEVRHLAMRALGLVQPCPATVAAPMETLASAFKMTRAAEGYAVNFAWFPRAFEFVHAS